MRDWCSAPDSHVDDPEGLLQYPDVLELRLPEVSAVVGGPTAGSHVGEPIAIRARHTARPATRSTS